MYFPFQVGPFLLSSFNCTGNESTLIDCPHHDRLSLGNCSTLHTAAVFCYEENGECLVNPIRRRSVTILRNVNETVLIL